MAKKEIVKIITALGQGCIIAAVTLFVMCPFSCKVTAEGIKLITGDYTPPVLEEFAVIDESNLKLNFSEAVNISGIVISDVSSMDYGSLSHSQTIDLSLSLRAASGEFGRLESSWELEDEGKTVLINIIDGTEIGKCYEVYGIVKDQTGNSITFAVPFIGFNPRIPYILMTEIQTVSISSQNKAEKNAGTYRNEFIEFLAVTDGNLCGVELVSGYDGEERKYVFPDLEVTAGEVFVVHLRNRGEGCINETGDDLDSAFSGYTKPGIRDLWSDDRATVLGNKNDVIILRNPASGDIIDGVMYVNNSTEEWSKDMEPLAQQLAASSIYPSAEITDAVNVNDMSDTKTMHRVSAWEIMQKIEKGEEIEFPVLSGKLDWVVGAESAGVINPL